MNPEHYIFDLTNTKNCYKGVLFAELDTKYISEKNNIPIPMGSDEIGIMAIIHTDEGGVWHFTMRIKYADGKKQKASKTYDLEFNEGKVLNETFVLTDIYKMPLKNKKWVPNPSGTAEGILKTLEDLDMIEFKKVIPKEPNVT